MTGTLFTEQTLAEQRPVLFRYALLQLRDSELADDAVQETLLAALLSASGFEGKAGLRTWLIGILKHKIADHWRRSARESPVPEFAPAAETDDKSEQDDFFSSNGHWNSAPKAWADPEAALKQQEFWTIYEICQNNLPPKMAQVFMLRELVGLEADEICREVLVSEANYWVILHRARLRLRECLEIRWFNTTKQEKHHA
ncbi:MAG: sigma-70 family RNA polymerase sigma factor [Gammaproteobacteria bacterium]